MQDQQPESEGEKKPEKTSFWKTVPGILTGIAAIVTATAALLTAVDKAGFLSSDSNPPQRESAPEGDVTTTGDNSPVVQNTDGDVNITGNE
ncbi:MAG: hypothetical protein ABJI96_05910 [Paracoccaceae bacterium]